MLHVLQAGKQFETANSLFMSLIFDSEDTSNIFEHFPSSVYPLKKRKQILENYTLKNIYLSEAWLNSR